MTAQLRLAARIRLATVAVLAFASVTAWFAGVAEATPEAVSRKLAANRGFTQARVKVSSTWHASCETPLMLAADVVPELFHFSLAAKSRVRVTLGPTYPRASRRLQIVRLDDEKFVACVDAEIDVAVGQTLDWTGVLEPDQYRVVVRVSTPQAAPVNVSVRLERRPCR